MRLNTERFLILQLFFQILFGLRVVAFDFDKSGVFVGVDFVSGFSASKYIHRSGDDSRELRKFLFFDSPFGYGGKIGYTAFIDGNSGIRTYVDAQALHFSSDRTINRHLELKFVQLSANVDLVYSLLEKYSLDVNMYSGVGFGFDYNMYSFGDMLKEQGKDRDGIFVPMNLGVLLTLGRYHVLDFGLKIPLYASYFDPYYVHKTAVVDGKVYSVDSVDYEIHLRVLNPVFKIGYSLQL